MNLKKENYCKPLELGINRIIVFGLKKLLSSDLWVHSMHKYYQKTDRTPYIYLSPYLLC